MGDKKKYLDDAVKAMDDLDGCRIVTVADYIETEPYGGVEQDDFLNSVLLIASDGDQAAAGGASGKTA